MKSKKELMTDVINACEALLGDDGGVIGQAFEEELCGPFLKGEEEEKVKEGDLLSQAIEEVEDGFTKVLKDLRAKYDITPD